jgi:hypothetical protein
VIASKPTVSYQFWKSNVLILKPKYILLCTDDYHSCLSFSSYKPWDPFKQIWHGQLGSLIAAQKKLVNSVT